MPLLTKRTLPAFTKRCNPWANAKPPLLQSLADTRWRLDRIPGLEAGIYALGRRRYADLFEDERDEQVRAALLDAHILMTDAKHLKNLHLQESRLRRQYRQDAGELQERQAERKKEQEKDEPCAPLTRANAGKSADCSKENGFEFAKTIAELGRQEEERTGHCQRSDSTLFCIGSV